MKTEKNATRFYNRESAIKSCPRGFTVYDCGDKNGRWYWLVGTGCDKTTDDIFYI